MKIRLKHAQQKQTQAMVPSRTGRCNAILASGKRCSKPSGQGTTHTGLGPCHLHQNAKKLSPDDAAKASDRWFAIKRF